MASPHAPVDTTPKRPSVVDYIQFQKWELKDCNSLGGPPLELLPFLVPRVSASYAMVLVFHWLMGADKPRHERTQKPSQLASSFFLTNGKVRLDCYNWGHGIVYEGCWVTYDDKIMCGGSKKNFKLAKASLSYAKTRRFKNGSLKFSMVPIRNMTSIRYHSMF